MRVWELCLTVAASAHAGASGSEKVIEGGAGSSHCRAPCGLGVGCGGVRGGEGNHEGMKESSRDHLNSAGMVHSRERGRIFCLCWCRTFCQQWELWAEEGSSKDACFVS